MPTLFFDEGELHDWKNMHEPLLSQDIKDEANEPIARCPKCEGTKTLDDGSICELCKGKGWLPRGKEYNEASKSRWLNYEENLD